MRYLGTLHIVIKTFYSCTTGTLHLFGRADPCHSMKVSDHACDIYEVPRTQLSSVRCVRHATLPIKVHAQILADRGEHDVMLFVDNGPDWIFKSYLTLVFFWRLFRLLGLFTLAIASHAPGWYGCYRVALLFVRTTHTVVTQVGLQLD